MENLNKALVDARREIKNPKLDSENPFFNSKFASLKSVIAATVGSIRTCATRVVRSESSGLSGFP